MVNWPRRFATDLIEFLFPGICPVCGAHVQTHGELCADCWAEFNWIAGAKCIRCGHPFNTDEIVDENAICGACANNDYIPTWIRSACVYDNVSRGVVLPFKHGGRITHAKFMARAMIWALRDIDADFDLVLPVPLAYRRLIHRTYNQAALLARPIARAAGVKMDLSSVGRTYRPDMGHLNPRMRRENIRGVFKVKHPENIRGRRILLVDDVMTTGATFNELARTLKRAGAAEIYGVTFCRTSRAA